MKQGVFYQAADGRLVDINDAGLEILGVTREEFLARTSLSNEWTVVGADGVPLPGAEHPSMVSLSTGRPVHDRTVGIFNPREKGLRWVVVNAAPEFKPGEKKPFRVFITLHDITDLKRREEAERRTKARSEILLQLNALIGEPTDHITSLLAEECIRMTGSGLGFFGLIDPAQTVMTAHLWSRRTMELCAIDEKPVEFKLADSGIWAEAVRRREPVVVNDYAAPHPAKRGLPAGHVPLSRFMSVPVLADGRVLAVGGVANKAIDYDEDDLTHLNELLKGVGDFLERRRLRLKLETSETRFRTIVEHINDGYYIHDFRGKIIDVNVNACQMLGWSREELLAGGLAHIASPENAARIRDRMAHLLQEGRIVFDSEHRHKDGHLVPVRVSARLVSRDGEGTVQALVHDISESKRIESQLRFQSMVLDQIQDNVTVTDLEGRITYVNEAESRTMGRSRDELIGSSVNAYGEDPERGATQREIIERTLADGEWRGEVVNTTAGGRQSVMDCRTRLIRDDSGRPIAMCGVSTDVTERKQTEERVRESEQRFRLVADYTSDWEYWVLPDGSYIYMSPSCREVTGRPREEFIERPELMREVVHPEDLPLYDEHRRRYLANKDEDGHFEYRILRPDGGARWLEHHCRPVFDDLGRYAGRRVSNRDVTLRVQAEVEFRRSRAELAAIFEHAPALMIVVDAERRILQANTRALSFSGRTLDDVRGRRGGEALRCVHALDDPRGCGFGPHCDACVVRRTVLHTIETGENVLDREARLDIDTGGGPFEIHVLVSTTAFRVDDRFRVLVSLVDVTALKAIESALGRTEQKAQERADLLRAILDTSPDLIFVKDRDLRTVACNKAFAAAVGKHPREMIGRTDIENGWDPEMVQGNPEKGIRGIEQDDRAVLDGHTIHVLSERGLTENPRFYETVKVPFRDESGAIIGILGLSRDVTDRRQAELEIAERNQLLIETERMGRIGSWEWRWRPGETRDSIDHSHQFLRLFQKPEDFFQEGGFRKLLDLIHPEDRARVATLFDRSIKEGIPLDTEFESPRADGTSAFIHIKAEPLRDEEQRVFGLRGLAQDVTEVKAAEFAVRTSEAKYRSLVEQTPAVTYLSSLDPSSSTLYISPNVRELLAVPDGESIVAPDFWLRHVHPDDRDRVIAALATCHRESARLAEDYRMVRADGETIWVRDEARIVKDDLERPLFLQGVMLEITGAKRAEEALRLSEEKYRSLFASINEGFALHEMIFDGEGRPADYRFLEVNPAFERTTGLNAAEIIGRTVRDALPGIEDYWI